MMQFLHKQQLQKIINHSMILCLILWCIIWLSFSLYQKKKNNTIGIGPTQGGGDNIPVQDTIVEITTPYRNKHTLLQTNNIKDTSEKVYKQSLMVLHTSIQNSHRQPAITDTIQEKFSEFYGDQTALQP